MPHPAAIYNYHRRIIEAHLNRGKLDLAYKHLYKVKNELKITAWVGLKAEIDFWESFYKKFKLTMANDSGNHTDFTGEIDKNLCRIDVTTNVEFKNLKDYDKFQKDGHKYYIALMSRKGKLIELLDINFPFCQYCGGRLFEVIVIRHAGTQNDWDTYALASRICSTCHDHTIVEEFTDDLVPSFSTIPFDDDIYDKKEWELAKKEYDKRISLHASDIIRYYKKRAERFYVACGENQYIVTGKDGDGSWGTKFYLIDALVKGYIEDIDLTDYSTLF